jgi:hypothetical protein
MDEVSSQMARWGFGEADTGAGHGEAIGEDVVHEGMRWFV